MLREGMGLALVDLVRAAKKPRPAKKPKAKSR